VLFRSLTPPGVANRPVLAFRGALVTLVIAGSLFSGGMPGRDHPLLLAAACASGLAALLAVLALVSDGGAEQN